tara:strand:+ start:191 stop:511 length:321 start_codon:yes stop_codon:yes gene_type:complete
MSDPLIIKKNIDKIKELMIKHKDMLKNKEKEFDKLVDKECEQFAENYPTIYEKIKNNSLNDEQFNFMLDMLLKVNNNNITQHNASIAVGERLVNQYVKPSLEKKDK